MKEEEKQLIELIRRIAKEVCYEILDEHLTDYKHKLRPGSQEVTET